LSEEDLSKLALMLAEIGIEIPLDIYIFSGVITLITAGLGAYFGAYLKKKGENKVLNENFSNIKNQLEETTSISESIKDQIGKESHKYRHKFESYHAKQIEAIEGIYTHLVVLEKNAKAYILTASYTNGENADFKAAKKATEDFIEYSNLKQMWMPENLFLEIEELALLMDKYVYKVLFASAINNPQTTQGLAASLASVSSSPEAIDVINNKVPQAKKNIINNVRQLLDPTHSQNS
jgi:hypothetical protein